MAPNALFYVIILPQKINQSLKFDKDVNLNIFLQIYKVDTESRDVFVWKDPGHFVSEPVFVARPGKNPIRT